MKRSLVKVFMYFGLAGLCFLAAGMAFAESSTGIDAVAGNITTTFKSFATLLTATSYLAGLGFAVAAILQFKAHKDNPQQIPISKPIMLLFIAIALVFVPALLKSIGASVFGENADKGTITGANTYLVS